MAIEYATTEDPALRGSPTAGSHVQAFLRLEGLAGVVLSAVLYARSGASWWLFAALWLTPDLSMLGYLGGPKLGARIYNAVHSYVTPATLAISALLLGSPALLPYALIWINHIAVDRTLGYGLKYPAGFQWTHLGKLRGRRAQAIQAG
ncbi:MAG: DUF4260 domain-containing protein [Terracidiphilus sp.]|jgi:hypothetical protein